MERLLLKVIRDNISECNYTQFVRWETKPNGETTFYDPRRIFSTKVISSKQKI